MHHDGQRPPRMSDAGEGDKPGLAGGHYHVISSTPAPVVTAVDAGTGVQSPGLKGLGERGTGFFDLRMDNLVYPDTPGSKPEGHGYPAPRSLLHRPVAVEQVSSLPWNGRPAWRRIRNPTPPPRFATQDCPAGACHQWTGI